MSDLTPPDATNATVEIYTTMYCPFCLRAKDLLSAKGVQYEEIDVGYDHKKRQQMTDRSLGRSAVPQIFINGTLVGGCDELYELERQGRLGPLLADSA